MWIFLAVLILLALIICFSILRLRIRLSHLRKETARKAALNIFNSLQESYPETNERVLVSAEEFPVINRSFYDDRQRDFAALGYRFAADIENLNLTRKNPRRRTMIRVLFSPDGISPATIYVTAPSEKVHVPSRTVMEVNTDFVDGTIVLSTTAPFSGLSFPPEMNVHYCPEQTSAADLVALHRQHLAEYQAAHPAEALRIETVDDLLASSARQTRLKHQFRKGLGYGWTPSEKEFFAQGREPALMKTILAELDQLAAKAAAQE